jgi:hypothetical protein
MGVLKDVDLTEINQDLLTLLLERGIYEESKRELKFSEKELFFQKIFSSDFEKYDEVEVEEEEKEQGLLGTIHFKNKLFDINTCILDEIYCLLEFFCELNDGYYEKKKIDLRLASLLEVDDKLKLLKNEYNDCLNQVMSKISYLKYIEEDEEENWKDYVYFSLKEDSLLIENYLKGRVGNSFYPDVHEKDFSIVREWLIYSKVRAISNYCTNKIIELEEISSPRKSNNNEVCFNDVGLFDWFLKEEEASRVKKELIQNGIFDNDLNFIPQSKQHGKKNKPSKIRVISGIGFLSVQKGYLKKVNEKPINQKQLAEILSNTFNTKILENSFSVALTHFADYYPESLEEEPNLALLTFI